MLTEEEEKLLKHTARMAEENHAMLKKLVGSMRWKRRIQIAYAAVVTVLVLGAYWFVQPYIESSLNTFRETTESVQKIVKTISEKGESILNKGTSTTP